MCFGGGGGGGGEQAAATPATPAAPTGSGPGGREKTTDEFYEEMKPGPFELPSLATGTTPVKRADISYGSVIPKQREGMPQRSLLVPFIRPPMMSFTWRKSS